eukprot:GHVU01219555.1.p1 GENE.GHVU01219555.1~~GHVU01219555.1.p1  ORF type:complete len:179 (+),score=23.60 GHVU01219555.1:1690-2226(+)
MLPYLPALSIDREAGERLAEVEEAIRIFIDDSSWLRLKDTTSVVKSAMDSFMSLLAEHVKREWPYDAEQRPQASLYPLNDIVQWRRDGYGDNSFSMEKRRGPSFLDSSFTGATNVYFTKRKWTAIMGEEGQDPTWLNDAIATVNALEGETSTDKLPGIFASLMKPLEEKFEKIRKKNK